MPFWPLLSLLYSQIAPSSQQYIAPVDTLPPTPVLPPAYETGYVQVNNVSIWSAQFGPYLNSTKDSNISPIVFLHGGFANSDYFGNQISALLEFGTPATIISVDSRQQGRSTGLDQPITYDLMRDDVVGLLDHFDIPKATIVGWSDGAIIGYDLAINMPSRLDRLFAFGGSYDPSNGNVTGANSPVPLQDQARVEQDYTNLSLTPDGFQQLTDNLNNLFATLPKYTQSDFAKIPTLYDDCCNSPFIWVVDASDEEIVNRDVPTTLHDWIPASGKVLLPSVGHWA